METPIAMKQNTFWRDSFEKMMSSEHGNDEASWAMMNGDRGLKGKTNEERGLMGNGE